MSTLGHLTLLLLTVEASPKPLIRLMLSQQTSHFTQCLGRTVVQLPSDVRNRLLSLFHTTQCDNMRCRSSHVVRWCGVGLSQTAAVTGPCRKLPARISVTAEMKTVWDNGWLYDGRLMLCYHYILPAIEIVIKFLELRPTIFSAHANVIKITIPKNGGYFKRRSAIGRRNTPLNSYVTVSCTQKTSSCLRK